MDSQLLRSIGYFFNSEYYRFKALFAYRLQGIVWLFYSVLNVVNSVIAISVIYSISTGIAGWSYYQMLLLAGSTNMAVALLLMLPGGGWTLISNLRRGGADQYLTRPYSMLAIMLSNFGDEEQLTGLIAGAALFAYAALQVQMSIASAMEFMVLFLFGAAAFVMLMLALIIISYYLFKSGNFMQQIVNIVTNAGRYPIKVYGVAGQLLFSLFIPIGLAYYYPSTAILGEISVSTAALAISVSIAIFIASRWLFYELMKRYTSGGG